MKQFAIVGIIFYIFGSCHAEYECTYTNGRTLYCESCCEYDCCSGSEGGLSAGAIAGISFGVIALLALKVWCICMRVRRYSRCTTTRVLTTVPRTVVVTNTQHAGYDQRDIPTIHQPNPRAPTYNQQQGFTGQQTNPNHSGYDQQQPNFEPIPPPPYDGLNKDSPK